MSPGTKRSAFILNLVSPSKFTLSPVQTIRQNQQLRTNVTKMRKERNNTLASFFNKLNKTFKKYSKNGIKLERNQR